MTSKLIVYDAAQIYFWNRTDKQLSMRIWKKPSPRRQKKKNPRDEDGHSILEGCNRLDLITVFKEDLCFSI